MQTGESADLTPSAKLRANLHGNDPDSLAFIAATENSGLHIGYERAEGDGRITCINTAFGEFKRVGAETYTEALTIIPTFSAHHLGMSMNPELTKIFSSAH